MATLKVNNLTKDFGNTKVLKQINLEVSDGEFIVLLGPSGCGKSTLLNMIAGLESVDEGEILIDDYVVNRVEPKDRNIAMVFQSYALYPAMTVRNNVIFGLKQRKVSKNHIENSLNRFSKMLQIDQLLERKPGQLSGGQRQRVAIARALALNPKLIIADEAVSALDVSVQAQVLNLMMELQSELELSFLFISHDMAVVERVSHDVGVMYLGRLVEIGSRQAVFSNPQHAYTKALMSAVPIVDPSKKVLEVDLKFKQIPSPIHPLDYEAEKPKYKEVTEGHFVLTSDCGY